MALLLEDIRTATELLHRVESSAANMRLFINVGKTKIMTLNLGHLVGDLQTRSGEAIENVKDFICLGSWIDETERDIKFRKGKTCAALHRLKIIISGSQTVHLCLRVDPTVQL